MKFKSYTLTVQDKHKCSCDEYGIWNFGIYKDFENNRMCAWCNGVIKVDEEISNSTENTKFYYEEEELEPQIDEVSNLSLPELFNSRVNEEKDFVSPLKKEVRNQSKHSRQSPKDGLGRKMLLVFLLSALLGGLLILGDEESNDSPRDGSNQEWIADNSIEGPTGTFDDQPKR